MSASSSITSTNRSPSPYFMGEAVSHSASLDIKDRLDKSCWILVETENEAFEPEETKLFDEKELNALMCYLNDPQIRQNLFTHTDFGKFCFKEDQLYFITNKCIGKGTAKKNILIGIRIDDGLLVAYSELDPGSGIIESRVIAKIKKKNPPKASKYLLIPLADFVYDNFENKKIQVLITPFSNCLDLYYNYRKFKDDIFTQLNVIKQIFKALNILHSVGIVHRDVKLENFLVNQSIDQSNKVRIKLIDFGLSTKNSDIVEKLYAVGTLEYLSHEMKKLKEISAYETSFLVKNATFNCFENSIHINRVYFPDSVRNRQILNAAQNISYPTDIFSAAEIISEIVEVTYERLHQWLEKYENIDEDKFPAWVNRDLGYLNPLYDLVEKMQNENPNDRPTAQQCLDTTKIIIADFIKSEKETNLETNATGAHTMATPPGSTPPRSLLAIELAAQSNGAASSSSSSNSLGDTEARTNLLSQEPLSPSSQTRHQSLRHTPPLTPEQVKIIEEMNQNNFPSAESSATISASLPNEFSSSGLIFMTNSLGRQFSSNK